MIENLSEQEKSVMLAKARGWKVTKTGQIFPDEYSGSDVAIHPTDSLYNPRHMALAWRVLNWAMNDEANDGLEVMSAMNRGRLLALFYIGTPFDGTPYLPQLPPDQAIKILLDTILRFLIKDGLIEMETST